MKDQRKRLTAILDGLTEQGATIKGTRDGFQVLCPAGGIVTLHITPGDFRAERNLRSLIRQHGLRWPLS